MADKTIDQLDDGNAAQQNDLIPIARGSNNFKITAGAIASLSSGTPGGSNTQLQFKNGTAFDGSTNLRFNDNTLFVGNQNGADGKVSFVNTSGNIATLIAPSVPFTSWTLKLPTSSGGLNQALISDGDGGLTWGSSASPSGADGEIQYKNGSALGGSANLRIATTASPASATLFIGSSNTPGKLTLASTGGVGGVNTVTVASNASSENWTFTLPSNGGGTGTDGYVLKTDGNGNTSWGPVPGGSGTPGGQSTQVQYNFESSFTGSVNFKYENETLILGSNASNTGVTGKISFVNTANKSVSITVPSIGLDTNWTMTLPTGPGTSGQVLTTSGAGITSWQTVSLSSANKATTAQAEEGIDDNTWMTPLKVDNYFDYRLVNGGFRGYQTIAGMYLLTANDGDTCITSDAINRDVFWRYNQTTAKWKVMNGSAIIWANNGNPTTNISTSATNINFETSVSQISLPPNVLSTNNDVLYFDLFGTFNAPGTYIVKIRINTGDDTDNNTILTYTSPANTIQIHIGAAIRRNSSTQVTKFPGVPYGSSTTATTNINIPVLNLTNSSNIIRCQISSTSGTSTFTLQRFKLTLEQ